MVQSVNQSIQIEVAGETVMLLPERGVFWPKEKTLLVTDLHWGKSETFQAHGIPISNTVFSADLDRLSQLIKATQTQRLVVLGDLIHHRSGLHEGLFNTISKWRKNFPGLDFHLVRGNHDRFLKNIPADWKLVVHDEVLLNPPFAFAHHPNPIESYFVWAGHLHPTVQLGRGRNKMRLPCFEIQTHLGILPAFSHFTAGQNIKRTKTSHIYAIADHSVIQV